MDFAVNDVPAPQRILANSNYPGGASPFKLVSMLPDGTDLKSIGKAGEEGTRPRYFPTNNTKMTSTKAPGGNMGSFLEDIADGANQVLITDSTLNGSRGAAVSPDGTLVVQSDDRTGYRANHLFDRATAAYIRKLTSNTNAEGLPVFSPNGQWIYFSADNGAKWDIYRIKPDGTGLENLTNTPLSDEFSINVSPDGTKMVYELDDVSTITQLYEKNSDGTGTPIKITNSLGDSGDYSGAGWPDYSSDGKKLAYVEFAQTGTNLDKGNIVILYKDTAGNWSYNKTISNPSFAFVYPDW